MRSTDTDGMVILHKLAQEFMIAIALASRVVSSSYHFFKIFQKSIANNDCVAILDIVLVKRKNPDSPFDQFIFSEEMLVQVLTADFIT